MKDNEKLEEKLDLVEQKLKELTIMIRNIAAVLTNNAGNRLNVGENMYETLTSFVKDVDKYR